MASQQRQTYEHGYGNTSKSRYSKKRYARSASPSSDYIERPRYSSSDYICQPAKPSRSSRPSYRSSHSHPVGSDYIYRPVEPADDYISPRSSSPGHHNRDGHTSRRNYSPARPTSQRNSYTRPSSHRTVSFREGGSAQPLPQRSGFANGLDSMRSHGLKEYGRQDFPEANPIRDTHRQVHAMQYNSDMEYLDGDTAVENHSDIDSDSDYETQRSQRSDIVGSDMASIRGSARSDQGSVRRSCGSSVVSVAPGDGESDGEGGRAIARDVNEDAVSVGTQHGSDYASVDGDQDGLDSDVCSDGGYASDVGAGEDYVGLDDDDCIDNDDDY